MALVLRLTFTLYSIEKWYKRASIHGRAHYYYYYYLSKCAFHKNNQWRTRTKKFKEPIGKRISILKYTNQNYHVKCYSFLHTSCWENPRVMRTFLCDGISFLTCSYVFRGNGKGSNWLNYYIRNLMK